MSEDCDSSKQNKTKMVLPTEKPEELVKAMEAIKNACKAVNSDFAEDPLGEKPASLSKGQVQRTHLYEVVKELYGAVKNITDYLESVGHKTDATKDKLAAMEDRVKDIESDKDLLAQKRKVGSIIIQSNSNGQDSLVKAEKTVKPEDLAAHAAELIKKKTGVDISEDDLTKLHYVPGGGIKIRFKDLKYGSKFRQVVAGIKKPNETQKGLNLYCNFELTKTRNSLLYEVRKAVREHKVAKYFVDYTGAISIQVALDNKEQLLLTRQTEVADANFSRQSSGKQPARTWSAKAFREYLSTLGN